MNREAFLAVADVIEYADRFDIGPFTRSLDRSGRDISPAVLWADCGTVGCVAGWTCAWADINISEYSGTDTAAAELGISPGQEVKLFYADKYSVWASIADEYGWTKNSWGDVFPLSQITAANAAGVLRRIANGELRL